MRLGIFLVILIFLSGCSVKGGYQLQQEGIVFEHNDERVMLEFHNATKKMRHDRCVLRAYTIEDNDLHLEYVRLHPYCQWQGLPSSMYKIFFKQDIKSTKLRHRYKEGRFDISLYEADGKNFYFVATYDGVSNLFILDFSGEFTTKICKQCEAIEASREVEFRFNKSLVHFNFFNRYFTPKDSQRIYPPFIL